MPWSRRSSNHASTAPGAVAASGPAGATKPIGWVQVSLSSPGKGFIHIKRGVASNGLATFTLPKLSKGTWKVQAQYQGSTVYHPSKLTQLKSIVVK